MAEDPKVVEAPGSGYEPQGPRRSTLRGLQERRERFEESAAGRYWAHLSTADFMNSSFAFAALAVLSAFPFLAVSATVIGGDIRTAIVARMGLNDQASRDIDGLIATGNQAVATLTWFSAIVLVLGGIGMASTLSAWYHRIYERTPPKGFLRHFVYQSAGVVAFTFYISIQVELSATLGHWAAAVWSSCSLSLPARSSGGGRPTCSCIAKSRSARCSLPEWRPEPA